MAILTHIGDFLLGKQKSVVAAVGVMALYTITILQRFMDMLSRRLVQMAEAT
jgi:hypothetical protein